MQWSQAGVGARRGGLDGAARPRAAAPGDPGLRGAGARRSWPLRRHTGRAGRADRRHLPGDLHHRDVAVVSRVGSATMTVVGGHFTSCFSVISTGRCGIRSGSPSPPEGPHTGSVRPLRRANAAACTRSRNPSMPGTLLTCVLVVGMLTTRRSQISALANPSPSRARTSRSLSLSRSRRLTTVWQRRRRPRRRHDAACWATVAGCRWPRRVQRPGRRA